MRIRALFCCGYPERMVYFTIRMSKTFSRARALLRGLYAFAGESGSSGGWEDIQEGGCYGITKEVF